MSEPEEQSSKGKASAESPPNSGRTFLCVVDDSEELTRALRFACRRAKHTDGHVVLLYVIEPAEFQHWMAVGKKMQEERREEAEQMMRVVSSVVQKRTGKVPGVYIREGELKEELLKLIKEEGGISLLVLGAATGKDGPGPLVSSILKNAGTFPIPVTIVPGNLEDEQIDAIA